MKLTYAIVVIELISRCVGGVMQSMPSIASCMDLDLKQLQLQRGSQSKPLGSLRWNLQVEGINRGGSRGMWGMHCLPPAIFHNALDK